MWEKNNKKLQKTKEKCPVCGSHMKVWHPILGSEMWKEMYCHECGYAFAKLIKQKEKEEEEKRCDHM